MKRVIFWVFSMALVCGMAAPAVQAQMAASAGGARDEAIRIFDDAGTKLVQLAEAFPAEKYTWRPSEGVRSVSEAFLHVAAGNFSIPNRIGTPPPEGIDIRGLEKSTTDKAKVIEILKQSLEHVKKAYANVSDADLDKTAKWFGGRQATYREIMFFLDTHDHEHLGQLIAYARMNGVVPPWSQ